MKISLLIILSLAATNLFAKDFPLREKYPEVKTISSEDLNKEFNDVFVIDARSPFEYTVININNSRSIPVNDKAHFVEKLFTLIQGNMSKKIIFYCNGQTCGKSYKAVMRAQFFGLKNVYAYDAGIFEWAKLHPGKTTLLGQTPLDKSDLISKESFNKHLLNINQFKKKCLDKNAIIFDGRDGIQKHSTPNWLKERSLPAPFFGLNKILADEEYRQGIKGKTICVFDAAGKQVKWLQYHLDTYGYKDYYFLKKGMWSVYKEKGAN